MQKNAILGTFCGLLIIGLMLSSGVARGQSDPCNFNDGSTVFSYQRVMACYQRVPFNPADLANAVAFLRAARERSDVREIMQARYNWRGELNALATRSFANDYDFQIALTDNHKKLFNPHWSYRRPGCYAQFLASFIPFDFGSAVITPQGGAAQQIVFIEAAPYRADLYRSFTGIDANAYVGMRLLSVNGVPALDYFRRFGTEVYRFDQNAGQGLNEVLQNGAYSLRISSTQDVPSDRAFDVFELESQTGQRMTLEVPWVFASPSALGGVGSPLNLSNNTQQFTAICLQPSSVATLAGSPTASVPNAGLLETKAGGEEELGREIAEKREIVRQLNESNRGPRSDYFEEPPGRPSALLPVIVPKRDSAVAYQLSNRATIIRLDNFGGDWKEEVTAATNYACTNSDNLIFDMRNNDGGSIDQVGWLTRHLLPNRTAASDHTLGGRFLSSNPGRNELVSRLTQYSGSLGGTCRYGYEPWCFIDPVTEQPLPADGWGQGGTTEVRGGVVESLTRNALFRSNRPKYSETNPIACPGKFRGRSLIIYSNGTGFSAGYFWPALMRPDATIVTSGGFVGEPIVFGFGRGGAVWSMNNGEAYREQEMIRIYGPASNPLPFIVRNVESRIEAPASYQRGSTNLYTDDPAIGDVQIDVWTDSLATDESVYTQAVNAAVQPLFSIDSVTRAEGNTGTTAYTFSVQANKLPFPGFPVTVQYATVDGTATVVNNDYQAVSGTLTFTSAGPPVQTVTVLVNGDRTFETNELFSLRLSNPVNALIQERDGIGTVFNDDVEPTFALNNLSANEGNSGTTPFTFTFTRSGNATTFSSDLTYSTANGTATAPGDYAAAAGTVTFAPGETTKTVTVNVVGDTVDEPNETFTMTITSVTNGVVGTATGTATIINDDGVTTPGVEGDVVDGNGGAAGDGLVQANDLTAVRNFILSGTTPVSAPNQFQRADVNLPCGNGQIDAGDVTVIRSMILGTVPNNTPACGPAGPLLAETGETEEVGAIIETVLIPLF